MKETQEKLHQAYEAEVVAAWREQLAGAAENPWLAQLLLKYGERLLRRFIHFYEQVRALPRRTRRRRNSSMMMANTNKPTKTTAATSRVTSPALGNTSVRPSRDTGTS